MLSLRVLTLSYAVIFLSISSISQAQETQPSPFARNDPPPKWATALPFQTLICTETSSLGVEAKNDGYQRARYPLKNYTISRLSPDQMIKDSNFCRKESRQGASLDNEIYLYEACYRFDNALNGLKAAQGWCTEMYRKDRPTNITCDFNQPILSFTPASEFMAYVRRLNLTNADEPLMAAAFTSLGSCTGWVDREPKPLVNFK